MSGSIGARFRAKLIDFSGLVAFLRNEHPTKTAESVEAHCGISAATVRKWMSGETNPNGTALAILLLAYGPEAFASCVKCSPDWLACAVRQEVVRKLNSEIEDRQRKLLNMRG
jgi:transcriptional regulator with XRE-family HTH domain